MEVWAFAKNSDCSWLASEPKTKHLCNRYVQLYMFTTADPSVVHAICLLIYFGWTGSKNPLGGGKKKSSWLNYKYFSLSCCSVFICPHLAKVLDGFSTAR